MKRLILLLLLVSAACQSSGSSPTSFPTPDPPESWVSPTPAATLSPDLSSYEPYTIDFLRSRAYGGGNIEVTEKVEETDSFTRYLIRYPSDGLDIHGFVNIPKGDGPFPVIVAIHGFVDPAIYETLDYTTSAIDRITQAGYIVIHPNLRGYPPSDNGDNLFRVGMSVDVLNLIALIKSEAGASELFANALPGNLGLLGHSMGGEIALRVLTLSSEIRAAVLVGTMTGDQIKNAQVLFKAFPDPAFQTELAVPPAALERISPMYYYSNITAPIQMHHGTADETVPVAWAEETCSALTSAGAQVDCLYYPEEDHTFRGRVADQFYGAVLGFYETYLSP